MIFYRKGIDTIQKWIYNDAIETRKPETTFEKQEVRMKKILAALLAGVLAISAAACSTPDSSTSSATDAGSTADTASTADDAGDAGDTADTADGELPKGTGVSLTVYSNSVSDGRGDWLVERAAQDGFTLQYLDAGAAEVQSRLIAEKNAPIADVVFGLNSIIWESLKAEDILIPYTPAWADEVSAGLNDPDGYYHAIVKQAILLVYDTNQLSAEEAPTDWLDLWQNEAFQGKYEYASALTGGTTRNVIAGILVRYADPNGDLGISDEGWEAIAQYYEYGVPDESGVDLYASIADTADPVLCGQMWSSGIEARDEQYGTVTGYVVPEVGVPYAVEGVAIVNGTKNEEEVKRFIDWFGSAQIQGEWAQEFSTLPANEGAVDKANDFNKVIAELPAQDIDWALVAENIDAWCEKIELTYMK